jgi:hypothetical protein
MYFHILSMVEQPILDLVRLTVEVSQAQTRSDSSARVICFSQRPLPIQHTTNIHVLSGIRVHSPRNQAAADIRLRPRGHRDQRVTYWASTNNGTRVTYGEIQNAVAQGTPKTNKAWATDICTECVSVVCIESDQNTCVMC